MDMRVLAVILPILSTGTPAPGAESTAHLHVSATVANTCEAAVRDGVARLRCSGPERATLTVTGEDAVNLPLGPGHPTLIPLPAAGPGDAPILVIAY